MGTIDIGDSDPADAVAAVTELPLEIAKVGWERCATRNVLELGRNAIIMPNYIEAQEGKVSNAQRCRSYREKKRDTKRVVINMIRDETDTARPRDMVDRHAVPSLAVPSLPPESPTNGRERINGHGKIATREKARDIWNEVVTEVEGPASERLYTTNPSRLPKKDGHRLDIVLAMYSEADFRRAARAMLSDPYWRSRQIGLTTLGGQGNMERFLSRGSPPPEAPRAYSPFRAAE